MPLWTVPSQDQQRNRAITAREYLEKSRIQNSTSHTPPRSLFAPTVEVDSATVGRGHANRFAFADDEGRDNIITFRSDFKD